VSEIKELQGPLTPLDQICEQDERQTSFEDTLEDNHAELNGIVLNETVPIDVGQLFETAKNLSLYSCDLGSAEIYGAIIITQVQPGYPH
jgi:hypothetical protein